MRRPDPLVSLYRGPTVAQRIGQVVGFLVGAVLFWAAFLFACWLVWSS